VLAARGARGKDGSIKPMGVKVGDRVLFAKWSGTAVKLDNEELMIMNEADIMGVLDRAVAEQQAA
jgi:chaperonin GroES